MGRIPEADRTQTYAIDVDTDDQTFTITATPTGAQAEDEIRGELGVDNVGRRTSDGGGDCW